MAANKEARFGPFKGLNNKEHPMGLSGAWFLEADNVDVDNQNRLRIRAGYEHYLTGVSDCYATRDGTRSYAIKDGWLGWLAKDGFTPLVAAPAATAHWCEADGAVFCSLGYVFHGDRYEEWGIPTPLAPDVGLTDGSLAPGIYQVTLTYVDLTTERASGAPAAVAIYLPKAAGISITFAPRTGCAVRGYISNADGSEVYHRFTTTESSAVWVYDEPMAGNRLDTALLHAPPLGGLLAAWRGRIFSGHYLPEYGWSVVWMSQPTRYHYFALDLDYFSVPGKITLLADCTEGVIVGTDRAIYAYTGEAIRKLADIPVAAGSAAWTKDQRLFFYTEQGVATALPLQLLTDKAVSLPFSLQASAGIVRYDGFERYVVRPHGDISSPYNPFQDTITQTVRAHGITL